MKYLHILLALSKYCMNICFKISYKYSLQPSGWTVILSNSHENYRWMKVCSVFEFVVLPILNAFYFEVGSREDFSMIFSPPFSSLNRPGAAMGSWGAPGSIPSVSRDTAQLFLGAALSLCSHTSLILSIPLFPPHFAPYPPPRFCLIICSDQHNLSLMARSCF